MQRRNLQRLAVAPLWILLSTVAVAQANKQRGATLGGLAGAVAGGLIGEHNGEAGAGAAIGGVVGAVTGGLLGDAADKEAAVHRQHQIYQQQYQQRQLQAAVSISDVVSMVRGGLSDNLIINQIQMRGVRQTLQVPDIIALHQQGVSEGVITAMQKATVGSPRQPIARPRPVAAPTPVIVQEHYLLPHYPLPRFHYRPPAVHHHHGFHIRF